MSLPALPANAPLTGGSRLIRALARWTFRRCGWRMVGAFPDLPKMVIIAAPHSSGWDAVWGLMLKLALGLRARFMAKQELFWWPLGQLLHALGAIATDRMAAHGAVGQMVQNFAESERLWLAIAPEGTRKKVSKWKTGFWHIAHEAGVPIVPLYFHYPEKIIGIGPPLLSSGDVNADLAKLRAFYAPFAGKYRGA